MNILMCSDGTAQADNAVRFGGQLAEPCQATATLLGIAEAAGDEPALTTALEREADSLRGRGLAVKVTVAAGEPIERIMAETAKNPYDLVVIGARRKGMTGLYWRSAKTYEVIKAIQPPVLVVVGPCERLTRILVCTGGKRYIEEAVRLTAQVAGCTGASVTLLHVMAEPPAVYADLVRMEEDVALLLASNSELGRNLRRHKETIERLGIRTEVRVRHGMVIDEVFNELTEGGHDMIVAGSSEARGPIRHYIMGDVTRTIVNRANCPVLVARAGKLLPEKNVTATSVFKRFIQIFAPTAKR